MPQPDALLPFAVELVFPLFSLSYFFIPNLLSHRHHGDPTLSASPPFVTGFAIRSNHKSGAIHCGPSYHPQHDRTAGFQFDLCSVLDLLLEYSGVFSHRFGCLLDCSIGLALPLGRDFWHYAAAMELGYRIPQCHNRRLTIRLDNQMAFLSSCMAPCLQLSRYVFYQPICGTILG